MDFNVTAIVRVGMTGVPLPVTGRILGLGVIWRMISLARAGAVLFVLAIERSTVLRACRSADVGGFGLKPAITNIIQAIPEHAASANRACSGTTNRLRFFKSMLSSVT